MCHEHCAWNDEFKLHYYHRESVHMNKPDGRCSLRSLSSPDAAVGAPMMILFHPFWHCRVGGRLAVQASAAFSARRAQLRNSWSSDYHCARRSCVHWNPEHNLQLCQNHFQNRIHWVRSYGPSQYLSKDIKTSGPNLGWLNIYSEGRIQMPSPGSGLLLIWATV